MNGVLDVNGSTRSQRRLPRAGFMELRFTPQQGEISAVAVVAKPPTGPGPEADPDAGGPDPDLVEPGRLEVSIIAPGGKVMASGSGGATGVKFDLSGDLANKEWRARVRNSGAEALVSLSVTFVESRHIPLTTPIAMRVLNHGLRTALDALGIVVHIDGENSSIKFSQELQRLSGVDLPEVEFDGKVVTDLNLQTIGITTRRAPNGRPMIRVFIEFETEGVEIGLGFVDLLDITAASIVVETELPTAGRPGRRAIVPKSRVIANIGTELTPAAIAIVALLGPLGVFAAANIDDVIEAVREGVERRLNQPDAREAIGRYLPEAFVQLVRRGHVFHQLDATDDAFMVTHFDPEPASGPDGVFLEPEVIFEPGTPGPMFPIPSTPELDHDALANLDKVRHIVVLMQENRSFDHMLGFLALPPFDRQDVDGVSDGMRNTFQGVTVVPTPLLDRLFPLSPNHDFEPVKNQIAGGEMTGFLQSFIERFPNAPLKNPDSKTPLSFYTADLLPTYAFLANEYMVCDRWFAAHPGPTQPNRFCTLSGSTPVLKNFGPEDETLGYLELKTFFEFLDPDDWVYFEKDIGFIRFYDRFRIDDRNVIPYDDPDEGFVIRASKGQLPPVTFIDPNFVDIPPVRLADDDLAPADVKHGQDSIACIYNTLLDSPAWPRTMFVITYDEHGGFFDHVPPPGTPPSELPGLQARVHPEGPVHLGVRVPAFVVSPWVDRATASSTKFDHTSIGRTILLRKFGADAPDVSPRMTRANHLGAVLTRDRAREDRPRIDISCVRAPRQLPPRPDPELPGPKEDDLRETMRGFGRPRVPL